MPKEIDQFRPVPFYFLNTTAPEAYTPQAVSAAMEKMHHLGYGGIVLFNKPPSGFDAAGYLSDTWFEITERFILAAKALDMQLWINDGFNYPPGDAAGRIKAAAPYLQQLRLHPNPAGKLDVRTVEWGFPAFEEPESSELFIRFVYEEYYKRFAPYFGNGITGFFSDADNRRFNAENARNMAEKYYPWSQNFSEIFFKRFNYRVEENLQQLFADAPAQVKNDYWQLCGGLYQQWFANNYAWCKAHNVLYTFHSSDTGPLNYASCRRSSVFTEGAPLEMLSLADYPGTDHEIYALDGGTHYDNRLFFPKVTFGGNTAAMKNPSLNDTLWDIRAKYAASAGVLNRRTRVMCEMFAATNWGATFNDLRRIAAWQIIQGVNFIVPHAVHHRLFGTTKFFAPPEFSHTNMQYGLREFNDTLAQWCQAAAAGEYLADYAVIDPTKQVWQDHNSEPFFRFCDQLNRRADGYVIVPPDYCGEIKNVIDPLKNIPELPPPAVTFSGGELAYMRRRENDCEFLLAANIWQEKCVRGTLIFNGIGYEIELEPGEIAIIGGRFESYRTPAKRQSKMQFHGNCPVTWDAPNLIPFEKVIRFNAPETLNMQLCLPAGYTGSVSLNGSILAPDMEIEIFDDKYLCCKITPSAGENIIELTDAADFALPALLCGEFDTDMQSSGDYAKRVYGTYMLDIYVPGNYSFTLTPRRQEVSVGCGWEKQGQLFYSGSAVVTLGETLCATGDVLELPGFTGVAECFINGKSAGRKCMTPYRFELPAGKNHLTLRLWNTMANRFERYAADSGLTAAPEIYC